MRFRRPHPERLLTLVTIVGLACAVAGEHFKVKMLAVVGGCLLLPMVVLLNIGLLILAGMIVAAPVCWVRSRYNKLPD